MLIIYPPGFRIPIKMGPLTFHVTLLSVHQKGELGEFYQQHKDGVAKVNAFALTKKVLGSCLKDIEGCARPDGSDYKLSFDQNGELTDECLEEISQIGNLTSVALASQHLSLNGMTDPQIEGVEIDFKQIGGGEKKSSAQASA